MSQSRSHQRAPFGFINSQRRSSLSIIAVIKMFWSCLSPTWNIFTEGITSQVWLLSLEKLNPPNLLSVLRLRKNKKCAATFILGLKPICYAGMSVGTLKRSRRTKIYTVQWIELRKLHKDMYSSVS